MKKPDHAGELRLSEEGYAKVCDSLLDPPDFNEHMQAAIEQSRSGSMKVSAGKRNRRK